MADTVISRELWHREADERELDRLEKELLRGRTENVQRFLDVLRRQEGEAEMTGWVLRSELETRLHRWRSSLYWIWRNRVPDSYGQAEAFTGPLFQKWKELQEVYTTPTPEMLRDLEGWLQKRHEMVTKVIPELSAAYAEYWRRRSK